MSTIATPIPVQPPLIPADGTYLVFYNGQNLPGFVQDENIVSAMNIASHYSAYVDGANSLYTGLQNNIVTLNLKVWKNDYATCKEQVQLAASILRSNKGGFTPLYIQTSNRYYLAIVQSIRTQKAVKESMRTMTYEVTFECKPWTLSDAVYSVSGPYTIDTDQVNRDIYDGTWTPTRVLVSGTDISINGETDAGVSTGVIQIDGTVSDLIVDTELRVVTEGGISRNNLINPEYSLYVGPGRTTFDISGATDCIIYYQNRWVL